MELTLEVCSFISSLEQICNLLSVLYYLLHICSILSVEQFRINMCDSKSMLEEEEQEGMSGHLRIGVACAYCAANPATEKTR